MRNCLGCQAKIPELEEVAIALIIAIREVTSIGRGDPDREDNHDRLVDAANIGVKHLGGYCKQCKAPAQVLHA